MVIEIDAVFNQAKSEISTATINFSTPDPAKPETIQIPQSKQTLCGISYFKLSKR
jgi:hypothetical protein